LRVILIGGKSTEFGIEVAKTYELEPDLYVDNVPVDGPFGQILVQFLVVHTYSQFKITIQRLHNIFMIRHYFKSVTTILSLFPTLFAAHLLSFAISPYLLHHFDHR